MKKSLTAALAAMAALALSNPARAESPRTAPEARPRDVKDAPSPDTANEKHSERFGIGAFGGLAFPRPLSIEGMIRVERVVGLGVEYSLLPTMTVSGVEASFWALAADMRVFPFEDGFFVGLAAGRQRLAASTLAPIVGPVGVSADTMFVNPRLGFLKTFGSGITLGIDGGVQIPITANFTNTIPNELASAQTATDAAHLFGKSVLPTIDLLRLGFMM